MRLAWLLALSALLAGCSGGASKGTDDEPGTVVDAGGGTATGFLDGVVVDPAIRPIGGANITLEPLGLSAVSGDDGAFRFEALAAGSYLVSAQRPGFIASQVTVSIGTGRETVRLELQPDQPTEPFPITQQFTGNVRASTGLAGAFMDSLDPTGTTGSCSCTFEVAADAGLSRLVLEATWTDWMADPTGPTEFVWQIKALDANGTTAQGQGPAPIRRVLGSLDFPAAGFRLAQAPGFSVSIYPDAVWPAVSQQYDAYLTLWYRGPPPEGWGIIEA
ncbi:MAG: carboxypeptidase-like regulatory domain-containing protein [Candidatus Thermoplasmatota archaeon]